MQSNNSYFMPLYCMALTNNTFICYIFLACSQNEGSQMIHIGGFTPWYFKYVGAHSQHGHQGVATEWESVKV